MSSRAGAGAGGQQVREGGLGDGPAVADDDDVVGGLGDLGEDVAGDQDGPSFGGQAAEQVAQPPDALRVQAVGGLVEDQHGRVAEQRGGQAEPLPHAEGVAAGALPGGMLQAYRGQQLAGPFPGDPGGCGQHPQVVPAGAARVRGRVEQRADGPGRAGQVRVGCPGDGRGAGVGADQPEQHPQRGGLPRAVGAEKPGDPAVGDGERHLLHRDQVAELLAQPGHLDGRT